MVIFTASFVWQRLRDFVINNIIQVIYEEWKTYMYTLKTLIDYVMLQLSID